MMGTANNESIKLSLHPSIIGWRVQWPELWAMARKIGYSTAVIPRDQATEIDLPFHGMNAAAMQLPVEVRKDEETFRKTLDRLHPMCAFSRSLNCKTATIGMPPSSDIPKRDQLKIFKNRLTECAKVLDEYSINLALECITPLHLRKAYAYELIWRFDEMLDFAISISPNSGLLVDAWHWHHGGGDIDALYNIPGDRILDVHISDAPSVRAEDVRDSERLLPGEGVIDLASFFNVLRNKSYSETVSIEVFGRGLSELKPTEAAELTYSKTKFFLESIGCNVD